MNLQLYFDGACEPRNPGGVATCGWVVLMPDGQELHSESQFIRRGPGATNNIAEWCGLGFALRWLNDNGETLESLRVQSLEIFGDSQLVICQLNGEWQCKKESMARCRDRCQELLTQLAGYGLTWTAKWVPREQNTKADALSRRAYEQQTGQRFPERRKVVKK